MKNFKVLPKSIGEYKVGIVQKEFSYLGVDEDLREISVTIYYPTDSIDGLEKYPYIFKEMYDDYENYKHISDVETHCYKGAILSEKEKDFPVIIYNHGYGSFEMTNTVLCSDLASRGFVVVCPSHPGESTGIKYLDGRVLKMFPKYLNAMMEKAFMDSLSSLFEKIMTTDDNEEAKLIEYSREFFKLQERFNLRMNDWVRDTIETADFIDELNHGLQGDLFKGRLRLNIGIGLTGHSYGGSTAFQACAVDDRFVCGVNIDGGDFGDEFGIDVKKPFMILGNPMLIKMLKAAYQNNSNDSYLIGVLNSDHLGFTDSLFYDRENGAANRIGSRDPYEFRELITSYVLKFFEKYLLNKDVDIKELKFDNVIYRENIK